MASKYLLWARNLMIFVVVFAFLAAVITVLDYSALQEKYAWLSSIYAILINVGMFMLFAFYAAILLVILYLMKKEKK
ncbi:MAG TPA: hypothetical protein VJI46_03815 [Candidatus Nanoarchaeia archaeon]|nr:hypothetical protein [Candidatus Nanoarchaeia archaeon]